MQSYAFGAINMGNFVGEGILRNQENWKKEETNTKHRHEHEKQNTNTKHEKVMKKIITACTKLAWV